MVLLETERLLISLPKTAIIYDDDPQKSYF